MKFTAKGFEESENKNFLIAVKKYGEQFPLLYNVSEDAKMSNIFRSINCLSNDISEKEIDDMMSTSCDAICSPCGKHFLFRNYTNSNETLKELGFKTSVVYTHICGYTTLFAA